MLVYSRPEKINCILKKNVQTIDSDSLVAKWNKYNNNTTYYNHKTHETQPFKILNGQYTRIQNRNTFNYLRRTSSKEVPIKCKNSGHI